MLSIPLPFIVGLAVSLTLYRSIRGADAPGSRRFFVTFITLYAVQGMVVGLRFGYGVGGLEIVQPIIASVMPGIAWLAFRSLAEPPVRHAWRHILAPFLATAVVLFFRNGFDLLLLALFTGYGVALLRLTLAPEGEMAVTPLQQAGPAMRAARLTGVLMLFFAASDAALALYTLRYGTGDVPVAVTFMNLAVIAVLVLWYLAGDLFEARPIPVSATASQADGQDMAALLRVREALDDGLYADENLSLAKLARKVGMPARDLSALINRAAGMNVSQFVNNRRIAAACRMLEETDAPTTTVMLDAGFGTKSNFNREFRRVTGTSPREWRARNRKGAETAR